MVMNPLIRDAERISRAVRLPWREWRDPIKVVTAYPFIVVTKLNGEVLDWVGASAILEAETKAQAMHSRYEAKGYPGVGGATALSTRIYRIEMLR